MSDRNNRRRRSPLPIILTTVKWFLRALQIKSILDERFPEWSDWID